MILFYLLVFSKKFRFLVDSYSATQQETILSDSLKFYNNSYFFIENYTNVVNQDMATKCPNASRKLAHLQNVISSKSTLKHYNWT